MPKSPSVFSSPSRPFEKSSQYRRSEGKPDYASLAYGEYGGKAGIWRIMDVLARNGVKGTIDTTADRRRFSRALKELQAPAGMKSSPWLGHDWRYRLESAASERSG